MPASELAGSSTPALTGLVIDWGGVLTPAVGGALVDWAAEEGIDVDHLYRVLEAWSGNDRSPLLGLERGELPASEFEQILAVELQRYGSTVAATGLLNRMLAGLQRLDPRMMNMLRLARANGIQTALLSNSWGEHYQAELWDGVFDVVVISGRVGMRKPEPAIFERTLRDLGLSAEQCVMVDDLPRNVTAASALGMVGVLHATVDQTLEELGSLFSLPLNQ